MQITSSLPVITAAQPNISNTTTKPADQTKPEDFLTAGDVNILEYVTNTSSLAAAEEDTNGKTLAVLLGTGREQGSLQGDVSKNVFYSQLTASDANLIEGITGTSNIIDAINAGNPSILGLASDIEIDRTDGSLTGNITSGYVNSLILFDKTQLSQQDGLGISVNVDTLNEALAYLKDESQTAVKSSYSTVA